MLNTQLLDYQDHDTLLEAYLAHDDHLTGKKPAVMVVHDWSGKNDFACQKADQLAQLGYVGVAIDMYGKGKLGTTKEEKISLMTPLMNDRKLLQQRIIAAWQAIANLNHVDPLKIGAIGFCFGGLCVLDLARSGTNVKGVVSFHGLLNPLPHSSSNPIKSKILALHGYDDPMVKPEQVMAFSDEMTAAKADWQVHMYSHTMHAFTNPEANDPDFGTVYNQIATDRSWMAMKNFFESVF